MREIKPCPDQEWKQLPTAKLDALLQAELEKEYPNEEVVLPILHILEERERDYPAEKTPEVLAILDKIIEHEATSKRSGNRRRWIAGIATAAAAACIIVMALPRTVGAESIFDVLYRWTKSIFEFVDPDSNESHPNAENAFATDHPGLQQLYDKVTELGGTDPVVPMWLPEGLELLSLKEMPLREGGCKAHATFKGNNAFVSISYRISSDISTQFEKKDSAVESYEAGGVSHFILENGENISVAWTVDGAECAMITNVAKEHIYTIITSIYRSELPQ